MIKCEVLETATDHGFNKIKLLEGEFKDVVFSYGSVSVDEQGEHATLHFDYDVYDGTIENVERFEQTIGDLLMYILEEQITHNQVVYANGTD